MNSSERMPTKAQFQTVIDNFKKVLPLVKDKDHLDMIRPSVTNAFGELCNTPLCVAGWYAVATLWPTTGYLNFNHGATNMAIHLGFKRRFDLKNWAASNPEIWGNKYGYNMFTNKIAWNESTTLAEVIAHLESVRDRLPE